MSVHLHIAPHILTLTNSCPVIYLTVRFFQILTNLKNYRFFVFLKEKSFQFFSKTIFLNRNQSQHLFIHFFFTSILSLQLLFQKCESLFSLINLARSISDVLFGNFFCTIRPSHFPGNWRRIDFSLIAP